jgi:hypothetical protein
MRYLCSALREASYSSKVLRCSGVFRKLRQLSVWGEVSDRLHTGQKRRVSLVLQQVS